MRIIDLHCDSIGEMFDQGVDFSSEILDVSTSSVKAYSEYMQVCAVWSPKPMTNKECWERFVSAVDYMERLNYPDNFRCVLAVEDARLIETDITRLDLMRDVGVRFLTLTWAGETQIGGAHDTNKPLSAFGEKVVERCFEIGIIPDVSHSSDAVFDRVFSLAKKKGKPFVATHSNSRDVFSHTRNITDDMYLAIASVHGLIGVSLEPTHLSRSPDISAAVKHIMHYFGLNENNVCLGCDFDGRTARTPGLERADALFDLAKALVSEGLSEDDVDRIFYRNAERFLKENNII